MRYLFTLFICLSLTQSFAQQEYHFVDIENDSTFEDLKLLDSLDTNYRLFFSGENHAFQLSNLKLEIKLLKYFHEQHGVNTLLLEFGEATGWMANEYLITGDEKLDESIERHFSKGFYEYFKQVKKYNDSLPDSNKIKIVGIDLQRSFSIAFEMLNYLLPADSVLPADSILQQIELIKFLQGYNKARIDNNKNSNDYYFNGRKYNNYKSMKLLIDNFNKFEKDYESYFEGNFPIVKEFMKTIEQSYIYKEKDASGTPIGVLFREQFMYEKVNNLAKNNQDEKFYGQFGRSHTLKNINSNNYAHNFSSMVAKTNRNPKSTLFNKVMPIGIYYVEGVENGGSNRYQGSNEIEKNILDYLEDFPEDSIAIMEVEKNSRIDTALNFNYEYIFVHNGSYTEEIINQYYSQNYDTIEEDIFSLNYSMGQYQADLSNTLDYFQPNYEIPFVEYWQLGFGMRYTNRFYMDYQFSFFNKYNFQLSDSSSALFRGFNIAVNYGVDIFNSRRFDLIPMVGFGYQRSKLKINVIESKSGFEGINKEISYVVSNPAFVIDFAAEMRIRIIKEFMAISVKGGYRLDTSNDRWRYKGNDLTDVGFNQSALFYQLGVCFGNL